ncbi:protein MLP2-like isoform X2 [Pseudomyrmex gracilis]|nr:protein MLP2-like isoform X2 [Pseudomyrmex gracilis]XP_020284610.1 protein MLP2-like isoform X2 [Pseudomyrmex gracilis]XP_020284611.1 protein MLP2-like isoform X2 [Pseudomyrmex gracilis]XP_020284612.1 protein MLP2-like isoform X2 [Pseudomyrmex gracilis]
MKIISECKTKDQKRTTSTNSVQKTERKRSDNGKTGHEKWRNILGQQNTLSIKEARSHKNKDKLPKSDVNKDQQTNKNIEGCSKQQSSEFILVQDRAVQCPDINKFDEFSSQIFSLKEKSKVKKDQTCNIATENEKLLPKRYIDFGRSPELTETKLETRTQSKEYIRKMKITCEKLATEKKELQRVTEEKDVQLKEVHEENTNLKDNLRKLMEELEETKQLKDQLEQQLKDQKIVLNDKIQLLQQNIINTKYVVAEKDYYVELCQHQDERIKKYQNTMKELQNHIVTSGTPPSDRSSQTSVIPTPERVSSTPNSSFSDGSWHDLSDISTVKQTTQSKIIQKDDVAHLDVSLLDEESSHSTIDSCQNEDKSARYLFNSVS